MKNKNKIKASSEKAKIKNLSVKEIQKGGSSNRKKILEKNIEMQKEIAIEKVNMLVHINNDCKKILLAC